MSKKGSTTPSLSSLLDIYNDALKENKRSKHSNIEFEVRFAKQQASEFDRIYDHLIMRGFKVEFSNYLLRVSVTYQKEGTENKRDAFSNIRVELDDMNQIQELCNKNTLNSNARFVSKRHVDEVHNNPYMIQDYKMRVSIQKEIERVAQTSEQVMMIQNRWDNSHKVFRYIYRTSLVHEDMPNIRIDLSKVRQNNKKNSVYFMDSNVLNEKEQYEIEIEATNINCSFDNEKKKNILKQFKSSIKFILSSLQNSPFPVKYRELDEIYKNYMTMIKNKKDSKKKEFAKYIRSGKDFIGPSSFTLQPINFVNDESIENICLPRDSFCVTDKADGERRMLYIDSNMSVYFITTNLEIQFTGIKLQGLANYKNTLLDGEYITTNKYGDSISMYAAFDIYYYENKDIRKYPFAKKDNMIESRYELLHEVVNKINEKTQHNALKNIVHSSEMNRLKLSVKSFFFSKKNDPQSLYNANGNCLKHADTLEYETDGIIFTPMKLGVTQEKEGDDIKNSKYTWGHSFKWKPPEFNTIDFLISTQKDTFNKAKMRQKMVGEELVNYYVLKLHVGVDKQNHGLIGSQQKLLNEEFLLQTSGAEFSKKYSAEPFYPTNPPDPLAHLCHIRLCMHEGNLKMFTEENQIMEDDTIVEFRYEINSKDKMTSWIPLRVRDDKTKEYKTKKNNFGNAYHVANSNWHSIHNPVTKNILVGETKISKDDLLNNESDIYYNNNKNANRADSHTIRLRKFHNFVKETLIRYASNKKEKSTLIDMAVGKAGDLHKWLNTNILGVLGIDISEDNIHNPHDGACKRYIELFTQNKIKRYNKGGKKTNMFGMFISGDTSKNINNGNFDVYSSKNENSISSDYILKCLMGSSDVKNIKEDYLKNNYNIFEDKFDICSIQFAVHYMFENKEKLYNFAKNVSDVTHLGSYLVGTCYDGKAVYNKLKNVDYDKSVEIYKHSNKIWSIRKKYKDDDDSFLEDSELSLGRKISVFQESINKEFDEYLVNFDYFEKVMNDHGFVLDKDFAIEDQQIDATENFENIYNKLYQKGAKSNMTEQEKQISFLNKCFVFKKINNMVKSYSIVEENNENKKKSTIIGYPKKTNETIRLQV
jgi:mRNA (guanine-N7-)-methyltransferase